METKFQTSFIPKKPMSSSIGGSSIGSSAPAHGGVTSLYMSIAVLIFIVSLGALGGSFAIKSYLLNQQQKYSEELTKRESSFETDTIKNLKELNLKIDISKQLLNDHLAISQIFEKIGIMTIEKVRFLSLDVTMPQKKGEDIKINLNGYATNYYAVAWQSDVLGKLELLGLRNIVKNPMLTNPVSNQNDTVSFGFSASIDPKSMTYAKSLTQDVTAPTGETDTNI